MSRKRVYVAGGVVVDKDGRVLLLEREVLRDDKWIHEIRLPKGHIDPGESHEQCARREVGEESGYWDTEIIADLGYDQSEFKHQGEDIIRTEHYFLMRADPNKRGEPAPTGEEEARFSPIWIPIESAEDLLTYPSEQHFVRRAKTQLHTQSTEQKK